MQQLQRFFFSGQENKKLDAEATEEAALVLCCFFLCVSFLLRTLVERPRPRETVWTFRMGLGDLGSDQAEASPSGVH